MTSLTPKYLRERELRDELATMESARNAEGRSFTQEEQDRANAAIQELGKVQEDLSRSERLSKAIAEGASTSYRSASSDPVVNPDGRRYSLLRAIRLRSQGRTLDGYEGEISREIAIRSGRDPQGFFMPLNLPMQQGLGERRDVNTTSGAGAIQTNFLGNRFIDALRNRSCLAMLGATMLGDVVGNVQIPKLTGTGTAYWVTEGNPPTESGQTIGQVALSPSTLGAFTDVTRQMMSQTSLDCEALIRNDLTQVVALELDRAGINGSGSGAEPTGILQTSGIPTVAIGTNGGAPTWAKLVELESTIATANADVGRMGYLTSCAGRGKLKTTEKGSAGYPIFLWGDDNRVNGYQAIASNQIPTNLSKGSGSNLTAMIFGDFSTVFIATWGALDVIIDPYNQSTSGSVRIVVLLDTQIKFRQVESLAKIVDMTR